MRPRPPPRGRGRLFEKSKAPPPAAAAFWPPFREGPRGAGTRVAGGCAEAARDRASWLERREIAPLGWSGAQAEEGGAHSEGCARGRGRAQAPARGLRSRRPRSLRSFPPARSIASFRPCRFAWARLAAGHRAKPHTRTHTHTHTHKLYIYIYIIFAKPQTLYPCSAAAEQGRAAFAPYPSPLSESLIRVPDPSLSSESLVRVPDPSPLSESWIRVSCPSPLCKLL